MARTAARRGLAANPISEPTAMDTLTPTQRSERMSRIKGKGSAAELRVRSLVHAMGYR